MAYLTEAILMTLSVFQSHSPIASLFKCDFCNLWRVAYARVARSLCIYKAFCFTRATLSSCVAPVLYRNA